jgi:hypothetical protein
MALASTTASSRLAPYLTRRAAELLFEPPREVGQIGKTPAIGDFADHAMRLHGVF